ncbi:MAG: hypothetical protein ABIU63_06980 [Chitinophagaceae bacterium]
MNDILRFAFSMSIVISVIIGIVRWRVIDAAYYPFIYNIIIVFLVEVINGMHKYSVETIQLINIFSIIDFCLFAWLFHNWGLFNKKRKWFLLIIFTACLVWMIITFFITGFSHINNPYLLLYSATLIFFSVTAFNKIVVQERVNIFTNARFWICIGIIIFYSFFIVTRATDLSANLFLNISQPFLRSLQKINNYSNVLVNLLYAVAVIWIPRKKNITSLL